MKFSTSNTKMAKRIKALLLILAMVVTMLPFGMFSVSAATLTNKSLEDAVASYAPSTSVINLSGKQEVYGTVDLAQLMSSANFPGLSVLNLSGTNITNVIGSLTGLTVTNTFSSYVPTGANVVFAESNPGGLLLSSIFDAFRIQSTTGVLRTIPTGMLDIANGTVSINSNPALQYPGGSIPRADILALPAGIHTLTLNFPMLYDASGSGTLAATVSLEVKKESYSLTPASGTVWDGGETKFTLTRNNSSGIQTPLNDVSSYEIDLVVGSSSTGQNFVVGPTMTSGNMSMEIGISPAVGHTTTGHTLNVYEYDPATNTRGTLLASSNVIRAHNPVLDFLQFIEYGGTGGNRSADAANPIGINSSTGITTIYAKGGTAVSSRLPQRLTDGSYTMSTMYLLQAQDMSLSGFWVYVPVRYDVSAQISTSAVNDLSVELVPVLRPNSANPDDLIWAIVVTAKNPSAATYTNAVTVNLQNHDVTGPIFPPYSDTLSVEVFDNKNALGFMIYQVPSHYANKTKTDIEDAIAGGDSFITLAAHYERESFNPADINYNTFSPVTTPGAEVVENSSIYLVALAYYEMDARNAPGALYVLPDTHIAGWYDRVNLFTNLFSPTPRPIESIDSGSGNTTNTTMNAWIDDPNSVFSSGTTSLKVETGAWQASDATASSAYGVFTLVGSSAIVEFPIRKARAEIVDYIIAPVGYVFPSGLAPIGYIPLNGTTYTIRDELQLEIDTPKLSGGKGRLYEINFLGEDDIAIGGTNAYEVWAVYNNYTVSNTYAANVSSGVAFANPSVSMPSPLVSAAAGTGGNSRFNATATSSGIGAIGATIEMTYSRTADGKTVSSKTVILTLTNSEITGLHLVFEDYAGNLYSSAPELNAAAVNNGIGPFPATFEIPLDTSVKVYAIPKFADTDFYVNVANCIAYAVSPGDLAFSVNGANLSYISASNHFVLSGDAISTANWAQADLAISGSGTTVTVNSVTYPVNMASMPIYRRDINIAVVASLITGIHATAAGSAVPIGTQYPGPHHVGDTVDSAPEVSLTSNAGPTALSALDLISGSYLGSVAPVPSNVSAAAVNAYSLDLLLSGTITVKYHYTYSLNGKSITEILPEVQPGASTDYTFIIDVGKANIEKIFLVARNPSAGKLTWYGNAAPPYDNNDYSLPYIAGSTIQIYPVAMSSAVNVNPAMAALASKPYISASDVDGVYFSYMKAVDFTLLTGASSPWVSLVPGKHVGTPKTNIATGEIYFEVSFIGEVDYNTSKLQFAFNHTAANFAINASAPYANNLAPTGLSNQDTLGVFHLMDADSAYVVDIVPTAAFSPPYYLGTSVEFKIEYALSSMAVLGASSYLVPATYFGADVMPDPANTNYNPSAANSLILVEDSIPANGNYKLTVGGPDPNNQNHLIFDATVVGTYKFRVYTVNRAKVTTPNVAPFYRVIEFKVVPRTDQQPVYYMEDAYLKVLSHVTGWSDISEVGSSVLDVAALKNGVLKMAQNTNSSPTVLVEVKDANGTLLAQVDVTTYRATVTDAALNQVTGPGSELNMANGDVVPLVWRVEYTASDGRMYYLDENITSAAWLPNYGPPTTGLSLSGNRITASASSSDYAVYDATFTDTTTNTGKTVTERFWAYIDATQSRTDRAYRVTDNASSGAGTVITTVRIQVGQNATLYLYDITGVTTGGTLADVGTAGIANMAIASVSHSGGSSFTINALSVGETKATIYPVKGNGQITIDVVVTPRAYTVSGNVSDKSTGAAIGGAIVTLTDSFGIVLTTTASSGGAYAFANIPNGTYTITASATGYISDTVTIAVNNAAFAHNFTLTSGTQAITISAHPQNQTVTEPAAATFGVTAVAASGTLAYQWQVSTDGGATWANISGATGASYTIGVTSAAMDANRYRCVLTAGAATETSTAALLTVNRVSATLTVSAQPQNQSVTTPSTAMFSVTATTTTGPLTYQWQISTNGGLTWANISGATGASYTTGATTTAMSGYQYRCVLDDASNIPVYTVAATLTVSSGSGVGPGPGSGSGGGNTDGGSGSATAKAYDVKVSVGEGGRASSNWTAALAEGKVTISVNPNKGYVLDSIVVTDSTGVQITLTKESDTKYSFIMPAANVTVTVTFEPVPGGSDGPGGPGGPGGSDGTDGTDGVHVCPSANYIDVDQTMWYHEFIDYVIENKIMTGTSTDPLMFAPQSRLTRAMMVQILYNMEGRPTVGSDVIFDDVPVGSWFFDAIAWSYENEIVFGYGNGKFGPNDHLTREQMVAILYRYSHYKGYDTSASADISAFADAASVGDWAVEAMQWAIGSGLIIGRDGNQIAPKATATRAEVATIVTRFCNTIVGTEMPVEAEEFEDGEVEDNNEEDEDES